MVLNTVYGGNRLQWTGREKPFHEIYFLKLSDPNRGFSLWVRYTVTIPVGLKKPPSATLWGFFHQLGKAPIALKKTVLLSEKDIFHHNHFIELEGGYLSLDTSEGFLKEGAHTLSWKLNFEDPDVSTCLYPYGWMYSGKFPKTKFVSPRVSTFVTGSIEVDHQKIDLVHHKAHQAHLWGTEYAESWAWVHCNQFTEDDSAWFEGLTAQVKVGGFKLRPLSLFRLCTEGTQYSANGLISILRNKSHSDLTHWNFEFMTQKTKFEGVVLRDIPSIVGVEYEGPQGEKRYCHNTNLAHLELKILGKRQRWYVKKVLTSPGQASFETVGTDLDPRVSLVL